MPLAVLPDYGLGLRPLPFGPFLPYHEHADSFSGVSPVRFGVAA